MPTKILISLLAVCLLAPSLDCVPVTNGASPFKGSISIIGDIGKGSGITMVYEIENTSNGELIDVSTNLNLPSEFIVLTGEISYLDSLSPYEKKTRAVGIRLSASGEFQCGLSITQGIFGVFYYVSFCISDQSGYYEHTGRATFNCDL